MPFDKDKFAKHLQDNAVPGFGIGKCAAYVRQALVAAGLNTAGNPLSAKDYGPFLIRLGFKQVDVSTGYKPSKGDVVVMPANVASVHGHIAGFDGAQWISDFRQNDMFGGPAFRKSGKYAIYRAP